MMMIQTARELLRSTIAALVVLLTCVQLGLAQEQGREKVLLRSSFDGSEQPSYITVPATVAKRTASKREADQAPAPDKLTPLVVSLHSWSADLEQRQPELEKLIAERNWVCLQPNFRGVNNHPQALASPAAQQDIIDAVDWALANYAIDPARIYLTGNSGGGHMTMMMAASFPQRWRAASAWVGISDLKKWHDKHQQSNYGAMLRACCGGAPGDSAAVDAEYHRRSPIHFLARARSVPLDIAAGVHDGYTGSVPIRQSLEAYNVLAAANQDPQITAAEIDQLSRPDGRLEKPLATDEGFDKSFDRAFYLRRQTRLARITIFEGSHEGLASATMAWFDQHAK